MTITPTDIEYSVIKETTPGTLPGTGALLKLPVDTTATVPQFTSDMITSPVSRPNRSVEAYRRVNFRTEGNFGLHLAQNAALELLMSSVLSNAWASSVLKGGKIDQPFSFEEKLAADQFKRYLGCYGNSLQLQMDFNGNATLTIGWAGVGMTTAASATSLTSTPAATSKKLTGLDAGTVSIGGVPGLVFNRMSLSITQPRETQGQFGTPAAYGVGANGARDITMELRAYHGDLTPYQQFLTSDTPVAVTATVGSAGNGFTFALPAGVPESPQQEKGGSALMNVIRFRGQYDATADTDVSITKL
ncbi:phage tail tube protein [Pacificimonas sp. ICDLI1SI03]